MFERSGRPSGIDQAAKVAFVLGPVLGMCAVDCDG